MPNVGLDFIAEQLRHVLDEQRAMRDEQRGTREDIADFRRFIMEAHDYAISVGVRVRRLEEESLPRA